jgi:ribosomal protein S18 acetylase RimI-like enzyme
MKYEIKEVIKDELEQCADVIRKSFGTVAEEFKLTVENCPTNGAFIKIERLIADKEKGNLMYGLFNDKHMIGFMQLGMKNLKQYELRKVAILPEYRHFGYGRQLLNYARNKVQELGGKEIIISIIEENEILKEWYLKNGFIHVGTQKLDFLPFMVGYMKMEIE